MNFSAKFFSGKSLDTKFEIIDPFTNTSGDLTIFFFRILPYAA